MGTLKGDLTKFDIDFPRDANGNPMAIVGSINPDGADFSEQPVNITHEVLGDKNALDVNIAGGISLGPVTIGAVTLQDGGGSNLAKIRPDVSGEKGLVVIENQNFVVESASGTVYPVSYTSATETGPTISQVVAVKRSGGTGNSIIEISLTDGVVDFSIFRATTFGPGASYVNTDHIELNPSWKIKVTVSGGTGGTVEIRIVKQTF